MSRQFKKPEYEATRQIHSQWGEGLPLNHLAGFGGRGLAN